MMNIHNAMSDTLEQLELNRRYDDRIAEDPNDPLKFTIRISTKVNPNNYFTFEVDFNRANQKTMLLESQNIGRSRIMHIMSHLNLLLVICD